MSAKFIAAAVVLTTSILSAQPTAELDDATATKIINLQSRNRTPGIAVAMILDGSLKSGPFETSHTRRVITVHPVIEEGRQARRMRTYDFHWTDTYGWFLWELREDPAGHTVWIWSQQQGEIVIR